MAPVYFVELRYDSGTIRAHSAIGTINWGGNDWLGVGQFGQISEVLNQSDLEVSSLKLTLSGVPNDQISVALNEHYQNRKCLIYLGFLDDEDQLVDTPALIWTGLMESQDITLSDASSEIQLKVVNELARWDKPKELRFNDATQRSLFPDDRFFEFVAETVEKRIFWGQEENRDRD
jgi:hypothetical protein